MKCPACEGSGIYMHEICKWCVGSGHVDEIIESGLHVCKQCGGKGLVLDTLGVGRTPTLKCEECYGYGGFYYDVKRITECHQCNQGKIEKEILVKATPDKPAHWETIITDCRNCNGTGKSAYIGAIPDKDFRNKMASDQALRIKDGVCINCGKPINIIARKIFGAQLCPKCGSYR